MLGSERIAHRRAPLECDGMVTRLRWSSDAPCALVARATGGNASPPPAKLLSDVVDAGADRATDATRQRADPGTRQRADAARSGARDRAGRGPACCTGDRAAAGRTPELPPVEPTQDVRQL